jgi:hypothetical protein
MKNPEEKQQGWEQYWGDTYQQNRKVRTLLPLFQDMYEKGELGKNIVDIGSGIHPVSSLMPPELNARTVAVDRAGGEHTYANNGLKIRFDLEDIDNTQLVREKIAKVAGFLGIQEGDTKSQIDCFVFSDVLNYVDYRRVLKFLKKYLKRGGRFIMNEWPGRGYGDYHSPNGLDSISNLYQLLEQEGFVIERGPGISAPGEDVMVAKLAA